MQVHVLLYDSGTDNEGVHSLELNGVTVVLMFENRDDAERYSGLLEAQDFPKPMVEALDREEIEVFCTNAGYEARFVQAGFVPQTNNERILLVPPEDNLDVSKWNEQELSINNNQTDKDDLLNEDLEDIRKGLEGLL